MLGVWEGSCHPCWDGATGTTASPAGHWAEQGGWAGRGGLFDSKRKKKNKNAFVFTTMSKPTYIHICTTKKEKNSFASLSTPAIPAFPLAFPCLSANRDLRRPLIATPWRRVGSFRDRNRDAHRNREAGADTTAAASQHRPKPWPFCSRGSNGCISLHQGGCPLCNRRKFKHYTAKLRKDGKRLLSEPESDQTHAV